MAWKTEEAFEKSESIVRALYSTEANCVYYIVDASLEDNDWNSNAGFILNYWPNRNKSMETVTLVDTFDTLDKAKKALGEKTDPDSI